MMPTACTTSCREKRTSAARFSGQATASLHLLAPRTPTQPGPKASRSSSSGPPVPLSCGTSRPLTAGSGPSTWPPKAGRARQLQAHPTGSRPRSQPVTATFEIDELHPALCVEIRGIDLREPVDQRVGAALRQAYADRLLVLF